MAGRGLESYIKESKKSQKLADEKGEKRVNIE